MCYVVGMKTQCSYADCNQSFEYGPEYEGKVLPCSACGRPVVFPAKPFGQKVADWFKESFRIYFDTNSVNPDASSPYLVVIRVCCYTYRFFAAMLLISLPLTLYCLTPIPSDDGFYFPIAHIAAWLLLYLPYKLARVIFDIAEYLRQINAKPTLDK